MYHYSPKFLREGINSTAFYSIANSKKLIIFVHGFSGVSLNTWNNFSEMIVYNKKFEKSDILFYGYDSFKGQVTDQSSDLYHFLDKHIPDSYNTIRKSISSYKKVIIIAHSLGAIVSRYALLKAIDENVDWKNKCKLMLFAPAHNGSRIPNLLMLSLPSFTKILGGLGLYQYPVIDDLTPGSACLKKLEQLVVKLQKKYKKVLTAHVIEAHGDKVVHNGPFCYDKYSTISPIKNKSHTTVCKPIKYSYEEPIDELINLL
ncbi:esterase/lipase family protein [Flavobacterium hauense]